MTARLENELHHHRCGMVVPPGLVIKGLSQVGAQNVKHGLRTSRHGTSETIQCVHRADAHRRLTMPKQFNGLGKPMVLGSVPI